MTSRRRSVRLEAGRRGRVRRKEGKGPERALTKRGVRWVAASVVMMVIGAVIEFRVLIELGMLGVCVLAFAWWMSAWNLRDLRVSRRMPSQVFAHRRFSLELTVKSHRKWWGHVDIEVEDRLLPRFVDRGMAARFLAPDAKLEVSLEARLLKRGSVRGDSVTLNSEFPLGLVAVNYRFEVPSETIVFPRPVIPDAVHAVNDPEALDEGAEATYEIDRSGEFRGIREFHPGDSLKGIHWPASARIGQLMVREFDRPKPRRFSIVFHSLQREGAVQWRENFDHALELLTGLLLFARSSGVPVDLTASFLQWERINLEPNEAISPVLRTLARAKRVTETRPDRLLDVLEALPGAHPVFVVSESSLDEWEELVPAMPRKLICLDTHRMRVAPIVSLLKWGDFLRKPNAA